MGKIEFLAKLREGLSGLPQEELAERLTFYREMIDDRMEEGLSEEEAVSAVGTVDEIVSQILADIPFATLAKERRKEKRRFNAWEIVLLILGFPLWFSLLAAAFAVVLSLYVSLWAVILSLWAVFVSMIACAFGGITAGVVFACCGNALAGIAVMGAGVVCAGLAIFMFFVCKAATKGALVLAKKFALWIRHGFVKKETV